MAKRDKHLYRSLRTHGVRKRAARTAAEAGVAEGEQSAHVLRAIAQELGEAVDALEARAAGPLAGADPDGALREAARRTASKQV